MNGMSEIIVCFLLLPVTLYIILPLVMLAGWSVFRLFSRVRSHKLQYDKYRTATVGSENIATA